ncbi:hypothetical protein QYM36_017235 [Artemia franciscana]|uniref:Uncharacterized protein n=1 Tax=Artemia franciscana TaxID=6661 RepID=A0AA88HAA8_ARTSF|nr:hypothetical protein QYM36_017235 [Artemia franciscana]
MSVPRKVSLITIAPSFSLNKEDDSQVKALRFEIDMFKNFKNEICQVNYKELVSPALKKNQTYEKTGNGSFRHISTSEDEDYPLEVAKKRKLQSGPRKRPKNKRAYDFISNGEGYDETDPFIDNSDAFDPYIPPNLVPVHGEFYVNSGRLKFKSVEGSESKSASDEPAIKKSRINSCSGESDNNEEEEYRKNNKVEKEHDEKDSMWKSTEESWSYGTYGTLWTMEYVGDSLEFSKINKEEAKQLEIPKAKVVLDTKIQKTTIDSVADAIESVVNAAMSEIEPTIGKSNPSKTSGVLATEQRKSESKMYNSSVEEEKVDRSSEQRERDTKTPKNTIDSIADEIESVVNPVVLEIEPTIGKSNPSKIPGTLATEERKSNSKMCNSSVEEEEEEVDRSREQREGDTKTQKPTTDSAADAIESVINAVMLEIEPTTGKPNPSKTPGVLATEERKSNSKMCNFSVEEEGDRSTEHRDRDTKTQKPTTDSAADAIESVINAVMLEIEPTTGKPNPSKTPGVLATEERKSKSKMCNFSVEEDGDRSMEHRDGNTKTQKPTTDSAADAIESVINAVMLEIEPTTGKPNPSNIPGTLATEERKSKSKMCSFSVEEEVDRSREQREGKESLLLAQMDFDIGRTIKLEKLPSELILAIEFLQQRAMEFTDKTTNFFDEEVNAVLLKVELCSKKLRFSVRHDIYDYLITFLPIKKKRLQRLVNDLLAQHITERQEVLLRNLEALVTKSLPDFLQQYGGNGENPEKRIKEAELDPTVQTGRVFLCVNALKDLERGAKINVFKKFVGSCETIRKQLEMIVFLRSYYLKMIQSRFDLPKVSILNFLKDEVSCSFLPGFFCPDFVYDATKSCHSIITSESKYTTKDRRKNNEHLLAILTS